MSDRPKSADTKCARLRAFMADGTWYAAAQLAEVGGSRFAARLFEIRRGEDGEAPVAYECRAVGGSDTAFEYRLRFDLPPEETPKKARRQSASALIREQAEHIARLTAELAELRARLAVTERRGQADLFGGAR